MNKDFAIKITTLRYRGSNGKAREIAFKEVVEIHDAIIDTIDDFNSLIIAEIGWDGETIRP